MPRIKYATPEERQEARRAQQRRYAAAHKGLKHELYERSKERKQQTKTNAAWLVVSDPDLDFGLSPGLPLCIDAYQRGLDFGTFTEGTILKNVAENKTYKVTGQVGRTQEAILWLD